MTSIVEPAALRADLCGNMGDRDDYVDDAGPYGGAYGTARENLMTDKTWWESVKLEGEALVDKLKELIHEGNVRRIRIVHQGRTVAEFPMTAGVVAAVLAPVAAAVGAVVALLKDCSIEVERERKDDTGATDTKASA